MQQHSCSGGELQRFETQFGTIQGNALFVSDGNECDRNDRNTRGQLDNVRSHRLDGHPRGFVAEAKV